LSALKLDAKVIVCLTTTGRTANMISGFRPKARIIAMTDNFSTLNRLELTWGIQCLPIETYNSLQDVIEQTEKMLVQYGLAKTGDKVVMTFGQPIEEAVKTNTLYIFTLGGENFQKLSDEQIPLRCRKEELF
jgi:pyruvate kinase